MKKFLYKGTIHPPKNPNFTAVRYEGHKIEEIPYFPSNLHTLEIISTRVKVIPDFPNTLKKIRIEYTRLENIPDFPPQLEELVIVGDVYTPYSPVFPDLPNGLKKLVLINCYSDTLLPSPSLKVLIIRARKDIQLNLDNYKNLTTLDITGNTGNFSEFPDKLKFIKLINCSLTQLPQLPSKLKYLDCTHNSIHELPLLPRSLQYLHCRYIKTHTIPELHKGLRVLDIRNTQIWTMPEIPPGLKILGWTPYHYSNDWWKVPHYYEYNRFLSTIKMFQTRYRAKILRKEKKERMSKLIANWIYDQGMKPGHYFARKAVEKAKANASLLAPEVCL